MKSRPETMLRSYQAGARGKLLLLVAGLILLLAAVFLGLCCGAAGIGFKEIVAGLGGRSGRSQAIIWMLRFPRIVMAALVGFGLGLAGAVFQAILRNPLASPFTLGVGSGAGLGAVSVIIFGGGFNTYAVAWGAFMSSLASAAVIVVVARVKQASSETMILTGIALMFLFSSLTSFLQYTGSMEQVYQIVFWFFGSFSKVDWQQIWLAAVMVLAPFPWLLSRAWEYNLLAAGDDSALALGVNVEGLRLWSVACASLVTAGCICFTGVIGFVGLVAPHIMRMIVGNDHRFLLPASALAGSVLLVAADILARIAWAPQVVPIGIVTSLIGIPFFFYLLMRRSREYW